MTLYICTLGSGRKVLVGSTSDPANPPHIQQDPITGQPADVRNSSVVDVVWPTPYGSNGIQALGAVSAPSPGPSPASPSPAGTWVCQLETTEVYVQVQAPSDPSNPAHRQPNPVYGGTSRIISARPFNPTRDSPGAVQPLGPLA